MNTTWSVSYTKARFAEKAGQKALAIEKYREALSSATGNFEAEIGYRLGHLLLAENDFLGAVDPLRVAAESAGADAQKHYRLGFTYQKLQNWAAASQSLEEATKQDATKPDWHYRLGQCREELGLNVDAISSFRSAVALDSKKEYYHESLLRVTRKTGQAQLVNDVLVAASKAFPSNSLWQKRLADSYISMQDPRNIAFFFEELNKTNNATASSFFREGRAHLDLGNDKSSRIAFLKAVEKDESLSAGRFGIGAFYQHSADYVSSAREYRTSLRQNGQDSELHYRLGFSLERSYHWEGAESAYEVALMLSPKKESWYYRLGLVRERLCKWAEAAAAYRSACDLHNGKNSYWLYRQAICLLKNSDFQGSVETFSEATGRGTSWIQHQADISEPSVALPMRLTWGKNRLQSILDLQDARASYSAGENLLADGDYESASIAFSDACQRSESFNSGYYAALGESLAWLGEFESSARAFSEVRIIKQPHGVNAEKYSKSLGALRQIHYAEYLDTLKVNQNVVLFESGGGAFIGCNPFAIYKEIRKSPKYSHLRFVWVINDRKRIPESLREDSRVTFVSRGCDGYLRYLASAGLLVNNNTFPPYFSRRIEQKYLNTWHGIPIKTLGRDIRSGEMDHKNAARNLLHSTHILSPNRYFTSILIEKNDIAGLFAGKVAQVGYPRVDQIVRVNEDAATALRNRLGISPRDRVLLYAPTWRGDLSKRVFDDVKLKSDIEALRTTGYRVLFKGHAMIENELAGSDLADMVVPNDIDTNELLTVVDVLVTDYSSILFDYLPSGKELYLYVHDLAEYETERGLYFRLDRLPAVITQSIEELVVHVEAGSAKLVENDKWNWAKSEFCPFEDGEATARAVSFFFDDDDSHVEQTQNVKKNVLFFQGSFIPNGISTAFSSLVRGIDTEQYRPVVVLEPGALFQNENRIDNYNSSKDGFQTLGRVGGMLANLEELWVIDRMNAKDGLDHDRLRTIYDNAFAREYRRIFGDAEFSSVVCFEGYAKFWAALLANGPKPKNGRSIYLHNDMMREYDTRFKYLKAMFALYQSYDNLVSVSKSVGNLNLKELSVRFDLDPDKFLWINNLIEPSRIVEMGHEPFDVGIANWISDASFTFVNVARLSPEKDQAKLIRAFAALKRHTTENVKLLIIGEGPLRQQLEELVSELKVADSVLFTGLEANPYSIMKACDCFVFSSNYEGQGLVVLESLVLDLPVLSTDVVGPQSILEDGEGMLVENSESGLYDGMLRMIGDNQSFTAFNASSYNSEALQKFEHRVLQKTPSMGSI